MLALVMINDGDMCQDIHTIIHSKVILALVQGVPKKLVRLATNKNLNTKCQSFCSFQTAQVFTGHPVLRSRQVLRYDSDRCQDSNVGTALLVSRYDSDVGIIKIVIDIAI